jgi:hypothetical protein
MNRKDFFNSVDVNEFVEWLVKNLPLLNIRLKIKKSRYVPNGLDVVCNGFNQVLQHYIWLSAGMQNGDWTNTRTELNGLSAELRTAIERNDEQATLSACENILDWGGDRNPAVGALPFLQEKAGGSLCEYIASAGVCFALETADTSALVPPVERMNAMLTKVHALYATDGLPIYDSRVAAAIASLVELWRRSTGRVGPLPPVLTFPATTATRTVLRLFPDAVHPGVLIYGAEATVQKWSSAKVRLGWIMDRVLSTPPNTVPPDQNTSHQERMHAFEASLFMIGYNPSCLTNPDLNAPDFRYRKKFNRLSRELVSSHQFKKFTFPLFRQGKEIAYNGDIYSGFEIKWGDTPFILEAETAQDLLDCFLNERNVPVGANMTGRVASNSLGRWLTDEGWPSRRYASAIAAVLANEGFVQRSMRRNCLDFIGSGETELKH